MPAAWPAVPQRVVEGGPKVHCPVSTASCSSCAARGEVPGLESWPLFKHLTRVGLWRGGEGLNNKQISPSPVSFLIFFHMETKDGCRLQSSSGEACPFMSVTPSLCSPLRFPYLTSSVTFQCPALPLPFSYPIKQL